MKQMEKNSLEATRLIQLRVEHDCQPHTVSDQKIYVENQSL